MVSLEGVWVTEAQAAQIELARRRLYGRAESEAWLRDFIDGADCPDYDTVMAAAQAHADGHGRRSWSDEYLHIDGLDAHGEIPEEFWKHVEVVLGRAIPEQRRATSFSCSC